MLPVIKIRQNAIVPGVPRARTAGFDLIAIDDVTVVARGRAQIHTGIGVILPPQTFGRVCGRRSLALRGVDVCGGAIDGRYRGEISVVLSNCADEPYIVHRGDCVARLVITPYAQIMDIVVADCI